MTNIFIDISIIFVLEHRSQVAKGVFLEYHLTIESNILLILHVGSTEIKLEGVPKIFFVHFREFDSVAISICSHMHMTQLLYISLFYLDDFISVFCTLNVLISFFLTLNV
jgi:hypothetical protein